MHSKWLNKNIHKKHIKNRRKGEVQAKKFSRKGNLFFVSFFILISLILLAYFANLVVDYSQHLPSTDIPFQRKLPESTVIYDSQGNFLYSIFDNQNRIYVPLNKIPMQMRYAMLAAEDINFYKEDGINPLAILRSLWHDAFNNNSDSLQGASTITQQLIKYTSLTQQRTLQRKVKEIVLTLKTTKTYSKDQILEAYLNAVPFGGDNYGIEAASLVYFGKDVAQLDLAQCAFLAGLPQAPSVYSPIYSSNPQSEQQAIQRQHYVLEQMLKYSNITHVTEAEIHAAENEPLVFNNTNQIKYPSFVLYIREQLYQIYGKNVVDNDGLKVYTTLNSNMQDIAQNVVSQGIAKDVASGYNTHNGALVAIDSTNGHLLAMVGSVNYNDTSPQVDGNVNMALFGISPGSSVKPFVYLTAFEQGEDANTVVNDVSTTFNNNYTPMDFDDKFEGNIPISQALLQSRNIPAVETTQKVGLLSVYDNLIAAGETSLLPITNYGLSMGIGGYEIPLLEHTAAYSVLSQDGMKYPVISITSIQDKYGKSIFSSGTPKGQQVFPKDKVMQINAILKNYSTLSPVKSKGFVVAGKTGTSQDNKNNLFMGYSSDLAVGVWAGNTNQSYTTSYTFGENASAPIWNNFMLQVLPLLKPNSNF